MRIFVAKDELYKIPYLDSGTLVGIVRKVLKTRIVTVVNTGLGHKELGIGIVGPGNSHAPILCF